MSKIRKFDWQCLFEEQARSGLTVVAFCKERMINPQTFYTQRYKYKKRGLSESAGQSDFIAVNKVMTASPDSQTITVQCGDISIMVPDNVDMGQLAALVKGLR